MDEVPEQIRKIKHKYAVSGSYSQFDYWRRYYRIPLDEIKYINDARHIRGANFSDSYIFFWGLWYESPVIEHEREYLEFVCNMISHYSLGASVIDVEPFIDFCIRYSIPVSSELTLDYFVRHSDPNEELNNVREQR